MLLCSSNELGSCLGVVMTLVCRSANFGLFEERTVKLYERVWMAASALPAQGGSQSQAHGLAGSGEVCAPV